MSHSLSHCTLVSKELSFDKHMLKWSCKVIVSVMSCWALSTHAQEGYSTVILFVVCLSICSDFRDYWQLIVEFLGMNLHRMMIKTFIDLCHWISGQFFLVNMKLSTLLKYLLLCIMPPFVTSKSWAISFWLYAVVLLYIEELTKCYWEVSLVQLKN